jgi:hypothetical protein
MGPPVISNLSTSILKSGSLNTLCPVNPFVGQFFKEDNFFIIINSTSPVTAKMITSQENMFGAGTWITRIGKG